MCYARIASGSLHYYTLQTLQRFPGCPLLGIGVLYTLFCWTLVPGLIAFVEIFLMSGRVRRHNTEKTREIVTAIRALRN